MHAHSLSTSVHKVCNAGVEEEVVQSLRRGGGERGLDVYSGPCHPFLVLSSRLKLLAKQTVNPGAGGAGMDVDWGRLFTGW